MRSWWRSWRWRRSRDEVICPSFTFFATAGCIARVGAKPVFADSCACCFNIDPDGIERLITNKSKAIIPVHLFGQSADLEPILEIARRHGMAVIEDAAQLSEPSIAVNRLVHWEILGRSVSSPRRILARWATPGSC